MRICHIEARVMKDDSGGDTEEIKAGMKFKTIDLHEDGLW